MFNLNQSLPSRSTPLPEIQFGPWSPDTAVDNIALETLRPCDHICILLEQIESSERCPERDTTDPIPNFQSNGNRATSQMPYPRPDFQLLISISAWSPQQCNCVYICAFSQSLVRFRPSIGPLVHGGFCFVRMRASESCGKAEFESTSGPHLFVMQSYKMTNSNQRPLRRLATLFVL